jgi:Domain of unknown function (DUF4386)
VGQAININQRRRTDMHSDRKTARIAGTLFIIATVASLLSLPFLNSISSPDYLSSISANGSQVTRGIFLSIIAAFSSASIAISMYPILRKQNEGLALGSVGFRLIEGVFYIVAAMYLVLLLTLSQEFVQAGTSASAPFQTLGALFLSGYHWTGNVGSVLAFCLGAFMYYSIFYQSKLVPRWLSGWGLIAALLLMAAILLVMFGVIEPMSTPQVILALPIAVQEMVLAIWLIVKGFNPSAIASLSAKTGQHVLSPTL